MMVLEPKYGPGAYDAWTLLKAYFTPNWFDFNPGHATTYEPGAPYLYLGLLAAPAIVWPLVRIRGRVLWTSLILLSAALFLANPPAWLVAAVGKTPLLNSTLHPFYFYGLPPLPFALLTGHALENYLRATTRGQIQKGGAGAGLLVASAIGYATWELWTWRAGGHFPSGWVSACVQVAAVGLALGLVHLVREGAGQWRPAAACVLVAMVLVDLKVNGAGRWFNAMPGDVDQEQPLEGIGGVDDAAYREVYANRHYRVATVEGLGPHPTDYRRWGLATPQGFDPFLPDQYKDWIQQYVAFHTNRLFHLPHENYELLQRLGVRYLFVHRGSQAQQRVAADPHFRRVGAEEIFCHVYEFVGARPPYRFETSGPEPSVELLCWEPEHRSFRVRSETAGTFVLVEQFYPGWKARVDGPSVPIDRYEDAFQQVRVEAGEHLVSFEFTSSGFRAGLWISLVSGVILVLIALGPKLVRAGA